MYCSKCGKPVQDGAQFCSNCGNPVNGTKPNNATAEKAKNSLLKSRPVPTT